MPRAKSLEGRRWAVWAVTALVLVWSGKSLLHLKHMEWFLLILALASSGLVLLFRYLRTRS